jgi:hypothetical protein
MFATREGKSLVVHKFSSALGRQYQVGEVSLAGSGLGKARPRPGEARPKAGILAISS